MLKKPLQERAVKTRNLFLDTAGQLLAEVGFDKLTTNLICERAGLTPPALYHYFSNKYEVVEELGNRLSAEQDVIIYKWMQTQDAFPFPPVQIAALLNALHEHSLKQPNAERIYATLRGMKQTRDNPLFTMQNVSKSCAEWLSKILPEIDPELIIIRVRIVIQAMFGVHTMLLENPEMDAEKTNEETAEMLGAFIGNLTNK
ncbi:TetR/AcrR family transcriptional regulator [Parasphingorhabdus halotolerans]|uniref:TetR/AcrR family transcriptional regulator n=1 Tax=Parasphingorhabdus halotolerans TaxID=2725558 RepID=A0A6H2DKT4_9SPHN|nr:TetR/AcrR family transcriptional regulator [Parasphingorhabdus halotolerans]QJB69282.1 TetR/AcrR family transcriptional regulator [Parasphingorhabdus halotolerans]